MNKLATCFFTILFTITLVACTSSGNKSIKDKDSASISNQIVKGRTTKAEIKHEFGEPSKVSFSDAGFETWEYIYTEESDKFNSYLPVVNRIASSTEVEKRELVILFDKNDKVKNYSMLINEHEVTEYFNGVGKITPNKVRAKNRAIRSVSRPGITKAIP